MRNWTEQDVIEKLNEGWLLSGDIGADAPFGLINPGQTRADFRAKPTVSAVQFEIEKRNLSYLLMKHNHEPVDQQCTHYLLEFSLIGRPQALTTSAVHW
jgi:hypothetical protein